MTVGRICKREVDLADELESVQVAAQRMNARNVGTLVVVDARNRPVGILTDRDLALRVLGEKRDPLTTEVRDVMTRGLRAVAEDTPIEDALAAMRARGVRRLVVVNEERELVGLVSLDDFLALLAEEFGVLGGLVAAASPARAAEG